ncbi:MAG: SPFH/Band 7/PHB domain protein [Erysipelotrichia bacterium]|nr:SPFH/Band 7/PHB domain protein [Erysipelotrichia bacterium]
MPGLIIALTIVGLLVIAIIVSSIKIVKQTEKVIVERLGAYHTTWNVGIHMLLPFFDRIALRVSMKEQVRDFEPQSVITKDNVTMQIDTVVFFYVTDAKLFAYGVENPMGAINYLSATTLRNIIGDLALDECLTSREIINEKMTKILDLATDPWGIKVNRVEVKNILPPRDIREAMEKQMRAEREKREKILLSEGIKQAAILVAEGDKQSAILRAEGDKQMTILKAEGDAESLRQVKQAEADSIRMLKEAEAQGLEMINKAKPGDETLKLRYYEALSKIADGKATKIFLPGDLNKVAAISSVFKEVTDK